MDSKKLDALPSGKSDNILPNIIFRNEFLKSSTFLVVLVFGIGIANFLGNIFEWNWKLEFYDSALHFLGGIWIAALFFYIICTRVEFEVEKIPIFLLGLLSIGVVAIVAIGWEWFEFLFDAIFNISTTLNLMQPGLPDTMYDLFFGIFGGTLYSFLVLKSRN